MITVEENKTNKQVETFSKVNELVRKLECMDVEDLAVIENSADTLLFRQRVLERKGIIK